MPNTHRTLKLSYEEIELIESALMTTNNELLKCLTYIKDPKAADLTNSFIKLQQAIHSGEKDV